MKHRKRQPYFKPFLRSLYETLHKKLTSWDSELQGIFGRRMESRDTYWLRIIPGMILLMAGPGVLTFEIRKGIFDQYWKTLLMLSIITIVPVAYFMYSCVNHYRK